MLLQNIYLYTIVLCKIIFFKVLQFLDKVKVYKIS